MRVFKKVLYSVLILITFGLWVSTASAKPNEHGQLVIGNVLTHTNKLHITHEPAAKDPFAKFKPSANFKQGCYWVIGMSTAFMFLCPLGAWEMTLTPVQPRKQKYQELKLQAIRISNR